MDWAYGITTVPSRRSNYLPLTIASLKAAGFTDPWLFVDGHTSGADYWGTDLKVSVRWPALHTSGNWFFSLLELYLRHPKAQRFALFQDDIAVVKNLRPYLDQMLYPECGYLNLYTMGETQVDFPTQEQGLWHPTAQRGRGLQAVVFDSKVIRELLGSKYLIDRHMDTPKCWSNADGALISAAKQLGIIEYAHNPSLVEHMGHANSSMGNRLNHKSMTFPGESFDAMTLISSK